MDAKQAIELLNAIEPGDPEMAHSEADTILLDFVATVSPDVAKAWTDANDRCGFWYA